jgi:hypothetical protein
MQEEESGGNLVQWAAGISTEGAQEMQKAVGSCQWLVVSSWSLGFEPRRAGCSNSFGAVLMAPQWSAPGTSQSWVFGAEVKIPTLSPLKNAVTRVGHPVSLNSILMGLCSRLSGR